MLVHVWGWNTMEERIGEHDDARNAFDPDHSPFAEKVRASLDAVRVLQSTMHHDIGSGISDLADRVTRLHTLVSSMLDLCAGTPSTVDVQRRAGVDADRELV